MTPVSHKFACRTLALGLCAASLLMVAGCGQPEAHFKLSGIELLQTEEALGNEELIEEFRTESIHDVSDALTALLGTPDNPNIPAGLPEELEGLLDPKKLAQAAGPVVTDEDGFTVSGLYRQHCAHCHGLSGDGSGPTAPFLNPYPRDYRLGIFKFKSTPIDVKPTDDDMHRILDEGIAGTAMPSFKLLNSDELDALVDYVKYLTIRGEVERQFFDDVRFEAFSLNSTYLLETTASKMQQWIDAEDADEPVPAPSEDFDWENAVARGQALYYTTEANCYTCHGPAQLGDGQRDAFDTWNSWAMVGTAMRPEQNEYNDEGVVTQFGLAEFEALGALPPRPAIPRNLRQGVFRFGRRPVDIYRRIWHGIDGTPMPKKSVSDDDAWYLVYFVRSLQYEALSEPEHFDLENLRERM